MVSFLKYRYLGKFNHDLTVLPNPGIMVSIGNHPQMAELFRLVKYYSLPIAIFAIKYCMEVLEYQREVEFNFDRLRHAQR